MLRISLADGERIIVNGAVLRSVGRSCFDVETQTALLRGRDVMRTEEADTPARRLYFACMMAYIEPERAHFHRVTIAGLAGELYAVLARPDIRRCCFSVMEHASDTKYYKALVECRKLIQYEGEILGRVRQDTAEDPLP
ncbi:hypothetical protein ASE95_15945 [Sphingomonas sp. Leaf231]|nr:hypothetical protein ASE95_15945 [Sphingomonas sp. Leaf231]